MEMEKFLEAAKSLDKKKKGKEEELEKMKKLFERFHVINHKYLDADTYEESRNRSLPWRKPSPGPWSTSTGRSPT